MKKPPLEFVEVAIQIASERFSASITGGGFEWISGIYEAYESDGSPADLNRWIVDRFAREFRCVNARPNWLNNEIPWPFMDGRPMLFVGELNGGISERESSGEMFFLFAGYFEEEAGLRRETKVITQTDSASLL
ncbi:hypothetical protein HZ994_09250 [Akkermansiaceae bacterium]|nr:hypothetical protein HZ994_09250 [Akkermansiaceae bacterium]